MKSKELIRKGSFSPSEIVKNLFFGIRFLICSIACFETSTPVTLRFGLILSISLRIFPLPQPKSRRLMFFPWV